MKKKGLYPICMGLKRIIQIMKITVIMVFFFSFQVYASSYGQTGKINLEMNSTFREVLESLERDFGYHFVLKYDENILDKKVDVKYTNESIEQVLDDLLKDSGLSYKIIDRYIAITRDNNGQTGMQQQKTLKGAVKDADGAPLPGVTVVVKGTTFGTITDIDGNYSLTNVPPDATLVFSFVGMHSQEVAIGNKTTLNVTMEEETIGLDEVVAVGYGTQKKVNLTGSVSSVSGEEMLKRPVTNPASMMQGQVPGLQVVQNSGEPGNEEITMRIRGMGTFSSAGSDPLVLIDGVEGKLSDLNPNNIESISVLKDAASASIYGARAANGVILVTTKVGTGGKLNIEYSGNYAVHTYTEMFDLITNSAEYMELWNEAKKNTGLTTGLYSEDQINLYRNATDRIQYPNTDWLDLLFDSAPTQTHNLSFQGGQSGTFYNVSLGYVNQEGIMKGFDYEKFNVRFNLKSQINDKIQFGANVGLKKGKRSQTKQGGNDTFLSAMSQAPTYSPQLPDGSGRWAFKAYDFEYNNKNPMAIIGNGINNKIDDYDVTAQGWIDISLLKSLSWYVKGAVNANFSKGKTFAGEVPLYNYHTFDYMTNLDVGTLGLEVTDEQTIYTTLYSYLKFDQEFNGGHTVNAQIGYSMEENNYEWMTGYRKEFPSNLLRELNAGSESVQSATGSKEEWSLMSFFGRLGYNYKDRYLLELNGRYDGTSRLSSDSRWGFFPSFSAGWRATEEQFVKDMDLYWLNSLKIRGSYGKLGNQNIGLYPYQNILKLTGAYSYDDSSLSTGVAQTALTNKDIEWETTKITDIGLDLTVFDKFSLTFDWYKKRTEDILRIAQVTAVVGLDAPYINSGTMENTGIELSLNYHNSVSSGILNGLEYDLNFNIDHFKNKLVDFGEQEIDNYYLRKEGKEWNSFYMLEWTGIFQSEEEVASSPKQYNDNTLPGDLKYKDQDGDKLINDDDRIPMGGQYPDLEYSFRFNANWKGFDFSFLFQGVEGRKLFVNDWGTIPFVQGTPPTTDWRDRWTESNPSTNMPRVYFGWNAPSKISRNSSWFLQDASYLRLKNLTLGYSLPQSFSQRLGIEKIRFYFSGDNLLTFTDYPGLDPERAESGSMVNYPQNKIYSFGINLKF